MKKIFIFFTSTVLCICLCLFGCANHNASDFPGDSRMTVSAKPGDSEIVPPFVENNEHGDGYMPPPDDAENAPDNDTPTVNIAVPTPDKRQTIVLWEKGKMPAYNESYQRSSRDSDDFIPFIESFPAQGDIKGAVLICPGAHFSFAVCSPKDMQWQSGFLLLVISALL